jgi:histidinol phosphatase-like enzyme
MIGDRVRDLIPAQKLHIKGILLDSEYPDKDTYSGNFSNSLIDAVKEYILT